MPSAHTRPIRVFSQDESRVGRLTIRHRCLTARGVQPGGRVQHVFQWLYVYGAVAPTTGDRFFLERPYLKADNVQIFINRCAQTFPESLNLLRLDNSGAYTARRLTLPENVRLVFVTPYGPELTPLARLWRDLTDALAWLHCPTLEVPQDSIAHLLRGYEAVTLQALTGDTALMGALHTLCA